MARRWFETFFDEAYLALLTEQWPAPVTRRQVKWLIGELSLSPGQRVLDVGCGFGRHALELARNGIHATGIDLSPTMLREAARRAKGHDYVRYLQMDMRHLHFQRDFDAVICLSTTFGYFNRHDNLLALRGMVDALSPGGALLIDVLNPGYLSAHFEPLKCARVGRDTFLVEKSRLLPKRGVLKGVWWIINTATHSVAVKRMELHLFNVQAWRDMLRRVHLSVRAVYGDLSGAPFRPSRSPRLVIRALSR